MAEPVSTAQEPMGGRGRPGRGRTWTASTERRVPGSTSQPRRLCSIDEAAEHLGVSVRFVRRLVAERRIRHIKVGHYVRFDRGDLDAFIAAGIREPIER